MTRVADPCAGCTLLLRNCQEACFVNLRLFRQMLLVLLKDLLAIRSFELGVCLVDSAEITRLNESFLDHQGPTDVITFNYSERGSTSVLHGDVFICMTEAVRQAREFGSTWQSELVRYAVHGLLHLQGYDDRQSDARRTMKRQEQRLVKALAKQFALRELGRKMNHRES